MEKDEKTARRKITTDYRNRLKGAGFSRCEVHVHEDDKAKVRAYAHKLNAKRLKAKLLDEEQADPPPPTPST